MTDAQLAQLRVALLALMPKDGTPWSVASLAAAARCTQAEVTNALFDPWHTGRVGYLREQDAYYLIKQGDAL
jgi:hypothetical protein